MIVNLPFITCKQPISLKTLVLYLQFQRKAFPMKKEIHYNEIKRKHITYMFMILNTATIRLFNTIVYICKPDSIYVVKAILFQPSPLRLPGVSNISSSVPLE